MNSTDNSFMSQHPDMNSTDNSFMSQHPDMNSTDVRAQAYIRGHTHTHAYSMLTLVWLVI